MPLARGGVRMVVLVDVVSERGTAVTRLEQLRAEGDLSAARVRLVADGLGVSTRTV
ncbi:hypothetical protein [Streptomyces sp. NPDC006463]|uniref:hypothetical protein n=1 Tax=Streptomyces sp. NPDC006463 TaxID=3364746 RepID=UPI0036BE0DBB